MTCRGTYGIGILNRGPASSGVTHVGMLQTFLLRTQGHRLVRDVDVLHRVLTVKHHLRLKDKSLKIGIKVNRKSTIITLDVSQLKLAVSPNNSNAVFLLWSPPQGGHFLGLIASDNGNLYPETLLCAFCARIVVDTSGILAILAFRALWSLGSGLTLVTFVALLTLGFVLGLDTINVPVTIRTDCHHASRLAILTGGAVFTILTIGSIGTVGNLECLATAQCHFDTFRARLHISDHRPLLNEGLQFLRHLLDCTHAIGKVVDVAFIVLTGHESTR